MKKVVSLALSALLALSLAACSSSNTTSTAASSAATSDAASSEESTSDSSTSTASSAADNATAEPDIQFDESSQPQTIADNDTCTIILQSVGYDDDYGYYWKINFQNKTDDKTLCAITSSSSLNGIPADTSWFPEIGPGVKTTEVVSWDKAGLEIYGVKPQDIDGLLLRRCRTGQEGLLQVHDLVSGYSVHGVSAVFRIEEQLRYEAVPDVRRYIRRLKRRQDDLYKISCQTHVR